MKLTSIDFSHRIAEDALEARGHKPWETNLLINPHPLGILTTNTSITYCTILLEHVNEFHV